MPRTPDIVPVGAGPVGVAGAGAAVADLGARVSWVVDPDLRDRGLTGVRLVISVLALVSVVDD